MIYYVCSYRIVIFILNAVRCPYVTYVRTPVTVGVASSVANEVTMKITS